MGGVADNKAVGVMKAGNSFTIEPMINAGTHHVHNPLPPSPSEGRREGLRTSGGRTTGRP